MGMTCGGRGWDGDELFTVSLSDTRHDRRCIAATTAASDGRDEA